MEKRRDAAEGLRLRADLEEVRGCYSEGRAAKGHDR